MSTNTLLKMARSTPTGTTGAYRFGRYYDPGTAQFLTVDPLVDQTGAPYSYAGADPVNGNDPSGLCVGPNTWWNVICGGQELVGAVTQGFSNVVSGKGALACGSDSLASQLFCDLGSIAGAVSSVAGSDEGVCPAQQSEDGGIVLYKGKPEDVQLRPGERVLDLPEMDTPRANWKQNEGALRQEMQRGDPIRDSSVDPSTGALINNTGFLRAERYLLQDRGWTYDPKTTLWNPPA